MLWDAIWACTYDGDYLKFHVSILPQLSASAWLQGVTSCLGAVRNVFVPGSSATKPPQATLAVHHMVCHHQVWVRTLSMRVCVAHVC